MSSSASVSSDIKRTVLHGLHLELRAKMVAFAGYEMPIQYPAGIVREHLHTRNAAGLFDVSHMGQAFVEPRTGTVAEALETLTPADLAGLKPGRMRYALLMSDQGGIRDDFMAAILPSRSVYLVVNAATKDTDFAYIEERVGTRIRLVPQASRALLALQGPAAEAVLSRHAEGAASLSFMAVAEMTVAGVPAIVSRSGYTGEDGFEISVPESDAEAVARRLLAEPEVLPVGLGARDTLRLEAGLCLYGHDIDETTSPVEADLTWSIGKRRKLARDFPAAPRLMNEILEGAAVKRVGILLRDKIPAREGAEIMAPDGAVIGRVTSGGFGPSINAPIAMGYIASAFAADGSEIGLMVRGAARSGVVTPLPFVPHRYKRGVP